MKFQGKNRPFQSRKNQKNSIETIENTFYCCIDTIFKDMNQINCMIKGYTPALLYTSFFALAAPGIPSPGPLAPPMCTRSHPSLLWVSFCPSVLSLCLHLFLFLSNSNSISVCLCQCSRSKFNRRRTHSLTPFSRDKTRERKREGAKVVLIAFTAL